MDRKDFLKFTGSATALVLFGGITSLVESCKKTTMKMSAAISVLTGKFDNVLRLPPIITGTSPINLVAKKNTTSIIKGKTSYVFGYGDSILAPIIKVNNEYL